MKKIFLITLIIVSLSTATLVLARSLYYAPNDEDRGEVEFILESVATTSNTTTSAPTVTSSKLVESVGTRSRLPQTLSIPKLDIESDVQRLGVTSTGLMAAPDNFTDVSWYKYGTVPGEVGSAVMAGHEDNAISLDGVFKHLNKLVPGDDVYVVTENGERLHFRVVGSEVYPYDKGPLEKIFATADKPRLNLITCAGDWLASAKTNDQRLVVYTELVK